MRVVCVCMCVYVYVCGSRWVCSRWVCSKGYGGGKVMTRFAWVRVCVWGYELSTRGTCGDSGTRGRGQWGGWGGGRGTVVGVWVGGINYLPVAPADLPPPRVEVTPSWWGRLVVGTSWWGHPLVAWAPPRDGVTPSW